MDGTILPRTGHFPAVLAAVAIAALWGGAGLAGSCLTADVNGPVLLPDGSVHEVAKLTLCLSRDFSPVAGLHEISVNGDPVGLLLSRRVPSEAREIAEPFVVFERDEAGRLRLVGYASSQGTERQTYLLARPGRSRRALGAAQMQLAAGVGSGTAVELAARVSR